MPNNTPAQSAIPLKRARFVWFDGLLQGPRAPIDAINAEVAAINKKGIVEFSIGDDPAYFSLLISDRIVEGSAIVGDCREEFIAALTPIVNLLPNQHLYESTLRCTEVFEDEVRESVFTIRGRDVACLSRTRPPEEGDLARAPREFLVSLQPRPWGTILIIASLLLLVFGLGAWQSGWVDRVFAASSRSLLIEAGPFASLLEANVTDSLGEYTITIRRGPGYPRTREESAALTNGASTPVAIAAAAAIVNGNNIFIRLETGDGFVLERREVSLRELLSNDTMNNAAKLQGRISAQKLVLALDAGRNDR